MIEVGRKVGCLPLFLAVRSRDYQTMLTLVLFVLDRQLFQHQEVYPWEGGNQLNVERMGWLYGLSQITMNDK